MAEGRLVPRDLVKKFSCAMVVILLLTSLSLGESSRNVTTSETLSASRLPPVEKSLNQGSPLCGVYCLYAAFVRLHRPVDFSQLVDSRYVGANSGSSIQELEFAAKESGFQAIPMSRLTIASLRSIAAPTILHVKSDPASREYDHFVLFPGDWSGTGTISLIDPSVPMRKVTVESLSAIWDGNALIVSDKPIDTLRVQLNTIAMPASVTVFTLTVIAVWTSILKRRVSARLRSGAAQVFIILFIAILGAICFHISMPTGFIRGSSALKEFRTANLDQFVEDITYEELREGISAHRFLIIDARPSVSFARGHIAGAVSIDRNTTMIACEDRLHTYNHSSTAVVYCESETCPYSIEVARTMYRCGFTNIRWYKKGFEDWETNERLRSSRQDRRG